MPDKVATTYELFFSFEALVLLSSRVSVSAVLRFSPWKTILT
jgi:hypothetical protein